MSEIATAKSADEALQATLQAILETLKPERALVLYGYDQEDLLRARFAHGLDVNSVYTTGEVSLGILQEVLDGGQPKILVDAMTDPRYGERTSTVLSGIRSVICCPLMDPEGAPVGLLYADSRVQVAAFRQAHLGWFKELGAELQAKLKEFA